MNNKLNFSCVKLTKREILKGLQTEVDAKIKKMVIDI